MTGLEGMTFGSCRILKRIGGGGMGDIYLAEQPALDRQVAVKVIRSEVNLEATPDTQAHITEQFTHEARAVAALEHHHILPIYAFGQEHGVHYLMMQYVPTGSLADMIAPGPLHRFALPLAPALVADIVEQAAGALQYAHERGVVHLDVKPQNLLVRLLPPSSSPNVASRAGDAGAAQPPDNGQAHVHVLLADFGLARIVNWLSAHSGVTGTPLYTAPEQYAGQPLPASDQYALACVAYQLLTGQAVFAGTLAELHHQHLSVEPRPASSVNPYVSAATSAVLARALSKHPAARFPSIREFARALRETITASSYGDVAAGAYPALPSAPISMLRPAAYASPAAPPASDTPPMMYPNALPTAGSPFGIASGAPTSSQRSIPLGGYRTAAPPPAVVPTGGPRVAPDAPGAPLPTTGYQNPLSRRVTNSMSLVRAREFSLRTRLISGGLALLLILVTAVGVVLKTTQPSQSPSATDALLRQIRSSAHGISRYGVNDVSTLPELVPSSLSPSVFYPQTRLLQLQSGTPERPAPSLAELPPLPSTKASVVANSPAMLSSTSVTLNASHLGVTSAQVAHQNPGVISVGSNGSAMVEAVDQVIQIRSADTVRNLNVTDFFNSVRHSGSVFAEPQVRFDTSVGRWILVQNEVIPGNNGTTGSYFDIAISGSSSPLAGWYVYQISTQFSAYGTCNWADAPHIGMNATAFFLTGASFACGNDGALLGSDVWLLRKQSFMAGNADTVFAWSGFLAPRLQPLLTLVPAIESSGEDTEWLLGNDAGYLDNAEVSSQIVAYSLDNTSAVASNALPTLQVHVLTLPYSYADPPAAGQRGTTALLPTGDSRLHEVYLSGGHLYTSFSSAVRWQGVRAITSAVYWLDLTPASRPVPDGLHSNESVTLAQEGIIGLPGESVFDPSLVADAQGNLMLAAVLVGGSDFPTIVLAARQRTDPPNLMGATNQSAVVQASVTSYRRFTWSDYVSLSADPLGTGPSHFSVWVAGLDKNPSAVGWFLHLWQYGVAAA